MLEEEKVKRKKMKTLLAKYFETELKRNELRFQIFAVQQWEDVSPTLSDFMTTSEMSEHILHI